MNQAEYSQELILILVIQFSSKLQLSLELYKPLIFTKLFSDNNPDSANDFKNNLKHIES